MSYFPFNMCPKTLALSHVMQDHLIFHTNSFLFFLEEKLIEKLKGLFKESCSSLLQSFHS